MKWVVKLLKKECPFAQGEKKYIFVSIFLVSGVNDVKFLYLRLFSRICILVNWSIVLYKSTLK